LAVPVDGGGTFWFAGSYLCTAFGFDGPAVPLPPKGEAGLAPNRVDVVPVPKPPVVAAGLLPKRPPPVVEAPPNVEVWPPPNRPPPATPASAVLLKSTIRGSCSLEAGCPNVLCPVAPNPGREPNAGLCCWVVPPNPGRPVSTARPEWTV
jgi:hypothetical protein